MIIQICTGPVGYTPRRMVFTEVAMGEVYLGKDARIYINYSKDTELYL